MSSRAVRRPVRALSRTSRRVASLRAAVESLEVRRLLSHNLTIGNAPTANVTVNGGSYTANADGANINVNDLRGALNNGNVSISTGTGGSQMGVVTWMPSADLNYSGPAGNTLAIQTGGDNTGGFHLFSNIAAANPLNLAVSSRSDVDLFGNIDDSGANAVFTANNFYFSNSSNHLNVGGGAVTIQPTAGTPVVLGTPTASAALTINNGTLNDISAGSIQLGGAAGGPVTINAAIQDAQDANMTIVSGGQINIPAGGTLTSNNGTLTLLASQQPTPAAGNFAGIYLNGGQIASNTGAVLLQGTGGATGDADGGVVIDGAGSQVTTASADIQILGAAGGAGASDGVDITNGATVSAGGSGNLTITGTGAAGAGAAGVLIGLNTSPQTIVSVTDGNLIVNGTGSGSAGNKGISLASGAQLRATGASNRIALTGAAAAPDTAAIFFGDFTGLAANHANVTLTGDTIDLGNFHTLTSNGANSLTLVPASLSRNVVVGGIFDAPGALTFTAKDQNAITFTSAVPGFTSVSIGRSDGSGNLSTAGNVIVGGAVKLLAGTGGMVINHTINPTGDLTLTTGGSIAVGATGILQTTSIFLGSGGTISDVAGSTIAATNLQVVAATGIGSAASPLLTRVATAIAGGSKTGGVYITNSGSNNLHIGAFNLVSQGLNATVSGDIQLINNGTIGLDTTVQGLSGHGNITVTAVGAAADIRLSIGTVITTTSGTTTLQAGRDLFIGTNTSGYVNNSFGSGNVSAVLSAVRDLTINNLAAINAFGTGTITASAGRNMLVSHTNSASGAQIASQSGAIHFAAGMFTLDADNQTSTVTSTAAGSGADITISADVVVLTSRDFITAGTGNVIIQPFSVGKRINLGSTTDLALGTLEISNAELAQIASAAAIRIGGATAGDISVTAPISLTSGPATLSLITGGAVTETPTGSLSIPQLAVTSAGPVTLTTPNHVQTLAANTASTFLINNDSTPLTIGSADGINGVTTANATIEIDSNSFTTPQQPINAGTGTVIFAPATAGMPIDLGDLTPGQPSITDAQLQNITAGLVQIGNTNADTLTVTNNITTHPGFSALSLQSGGQILDFGSITIPSLSTISGRNAYLIARNFIGTYAGQTLTPGQPISLQNSQPLTIGTVGSLSGISTLDANVDLTTAGNLTILSNINAGNGPITLTPTGGDVIQAAGSTLLGASISQASGKVLSTYAGTLHSLGDSGITINAAVVSVPGNIVVDRGTATFNLSGVNPPVASTISGVISGAGGLQVNGAGTLGVSGANTYTGPTNIIQGSLNLSGSLASTAAVIVVGGSGTGSRAALLTGTGSLNGPVSVSSNASVTGSLTINNNFTLNGGSASGSPKILGSLNVLSGTFGGSGSVAGPATISGGTVAPASTGGVMNLAATTFSPASRFSVALAGDVPGFGYSQLNSSGDVNLSGADLVLSGAVTSLIDRFTIVQSTGTISGQFAQGNVVTSSFGGKKYQIVYTPHSVIVEVSADLGIGITGPAVAPLNSDIIYTVTLTNNGPSDATNASWTELFPAGETFVSATNNGFQRTSSPSQIGFVIPFMQAGTSQVYNITAHVGGGLPAGASLTTSVSATSDMRDEFPANNTASSTAIVPSADLAISANQPTGVEGSPLTYTLTVNNNGPADSQGVAIAIPVPAGSTYVSAAQTSGPAASLTSPSGSSGSATFLIPTLTSGASATFTITVTPSAAGILALTATVSGTTTGDPNSANNTTTSSATVADAPITATGLTGLPFVFEGAPLTTTLASITDSNTFETGADLTASIAWGDGAVSSGTLSQPGGAGHPILVSGTHTYAMEGGYTAHVTVNDTGGSTSAADAQVLVLDAPLAAQPVTFSATQGISFTKKVASFTDANPQASAFAFIAAINWGDGSVSDGLVQPNSTGGFDVIGTHTYASAGTQPVAVTIHDFATGTVAFSTANVSPPVVGTPDVKPSHTGITSVAAHNISVVEGHAFDGVLAAFSDADASSAAGDFTARVNWGDGTTSAGTVVSETAGKFQVSAAHTYSTPGNYSAKVTIAAGSGSSAAATFKAKVSDAPLVAATPLKLSAKVNQSLAGVLGSFTDTDPRNSATPHYSGIVSWGDGTTSAAKFVFNQSTGKWDVIGTHTYKKKGAFALRISVKDVSATAVLTAVVSVS